MFVYCNNNPVMFVDPAGTELKISTTIEQVWDKAVAYFDYFVNQASNAFTTFTSMCQGAVETVVEYAINGVNNSQRPPNIGKGTFAKDQAAAIDDLTNFKSVGSKSFNALSYFGVFIDVYNSTFENVVNGAGQDKIVWDATVDVALTGGNIWASAKIGLAVGAIGGVPGAVLGAAASLGTSAFIYWFTDYRQKNGYSFRQRVKGVLS